MKRHESLVPLSRDHHFGLIMAQRLILGRATNPRADWPTDRAQQVPRLVEFFKSDLRARSAPSAPFSPRWRAPFELDDHLPCGNPGANLAPRVGCRDESV